MSQSLLTDLGDSYPTCVETDSTLRVFSDDLPPDEITSILQIEPTKIFRKGDTHAQGRLRRKTNGWFYSTRGLCNSKDTRRHFDVILAALEGKSDSVDTLHGLGCKMDISSYWVSAGQGGPWLMPQQMTTLGRLGIGIWWDVYFGEERQAG